MNTLHEGQAEQTPNKLGIPAADVSGIITPPKWIASFEQPAIDPPPEPAFGELFPLMSGLARDADLWAGRPYRDVFVFHRLHVTTSAVAALDMLIAGGLDPRNSVYFYKAYPYAHKGLVIEALRRRGALVLPDSEMTSQRIDELAELVRVCDLRVTTIEDGAHVVRLILANKVLAARWIGGAEQTTRGTWAIDELAAQGKIKRPVVALSHSKIKADFEGPRIPASGLRALQNIFPHVCVNDWMVTILGTGTIGRYAIAAFEEFGCQIRAYDADANARLRVRHFTAQIALRSAAEAVVGANLILGTAGKLTIDADVIAAARGHVRVGSLSSEQVEIDLRYLERNAERREPLLMHPKGFPNNPVIGTRYILPPHGSRMVDVLFDGMPINFSEYGILCEKHCDLIVGWLVLCSLEVVRSNFPNQSGALKDAADLVFNKHKLAEQFERIWA